MAYRTPLPALVSYLDTTHGTSWAIWEFRAEGTGYPDDAVHGRILHFPFPDHHPPPFRLVPGILASMRNWLAGGELKDGGIAGVQSKGEEKEKATDEKADEEKGMEKSEKGTGGIDEEKGKNDSSKKGSEGRVIVVHCKAGKGRSGTMSASFLIAERGWAAPDALARFTERRMRPGFGHGVSIPSQRRWVSYVDRWAAHGKRYVERRAQVLEVHVWGVRDGVRVEVEGFVDEGRRIRAFHRFSADERTVVDGPGGGNGEAGSESEAASTADSVSSSRSRAKKAKDKIKSSALFAQALGRMAVQATTNSGAAQQQQQPPTPSASPPGSQLGDSDVISPPGSATPSPGRAIVLRPASDVILPTSDVKISVQRRSKPRGLAPSIVTSVAHVWFNAFFEGKGPELGGGAEESGVFEVGWDEMDGLKGIMLVGTRAFERMAVVWRVVGDGEVVRQPGIEEDVGAVPAANWRGEEGVVEGIEAEGVEAEAEREVAGEGPVDVGVELEEGERAGLKRSGPAGETINGEDSIARDVDASDEVTPPRTAEKGSETIGHTESDAVETKGGSEGTGDTKDK